MGAGGAHDGGADGAVSGEERVEASGHEAPVEAAPVGEPPVVAAPPADAPDRTWLYQLIGGAVALVAVTAVIAVLLTRSMLQSPDPSAEGRVRGTSFDSFNRADGANLEMTATGRPGQVVSGVWELEGGRVVAKADADAGGGNALALLDTGVPDQFVQATFFDPVAGSGLVTRFQGPNNFVGVTFAPATGTVQLGVTVDGRRAEPSKIGSALAEGEVTLGVRTEGENVIVYVNGIETGRQVVPEVRNGTRVGVLVRAGKDGGTAVDDVVAVPLSTEPVGPLQGAGGTGKDGTGKNDTGEADAGNQDAGNAPATVPAEGGAGQGGAGQDGAGQGGAGTPGTQSGAPTPGALEPGGVTTP